MVQGTGTDGSSEPVCAQGVDQIPGLSIEFACSSSQVEASEPILGPIGDASGLDLQNTVGDLLDALLDGGDLVSIALGDSSTSSSLAGSALSTSCSAAGTRIDVLDLPAVGGEDPPPVISVILGEVSTRVDVDTVTGTGTPVANPAGVTIVVPPLGLDQPLALGQAIVLAENRLRRRPHARGCSHIGDRGRRAGTRAPHPLTLQPRARTFWAAGHALQGV